MVINNNEKVISDEFKVFQRDVDIYLNQYLIINNINFEDNYEKVVLALSSKVNSRVMIYSNIGEIKYDSDYNNGNLYLEDGTQIQDDLIDLNEAINEEADYKIININGLYKVVFSKPLYINGEMKGILRYTKDYTELFKNGENRGTVAGHLDQFPACHEGICDCVPVCLCAGNVPGAVSGQRRLL